MSEALFGLLRGPIDVEEAVVETLREWLPAYLLEVESQHGLQRKALGRPPTPESYHGGLDWQSEQQDQIPEVIVICEPVGEPERNASVYIQAFEVQIGCIIVATEEPLERSARRTASLWAAATMLLAQHGGLGTFGAEETVLTGCPKVEFLDEENRRLAVGITSWRIFAEILNPSAGPVTVKAIEPEGPYPEDSEVKTTSETVHAVPISEEL